ncbi:MAG: GMC family oxidoreductase N-terminal domain-containing protein [Hyphomicrobiales bacterium]
MTESNFDYIIVGAGTAGCLLANRLSADPSKRVLLLEAGGRDNYHWIHIPVGYLYCIGNPRTDWLYNTLPDKGLNGRSLRYPRGKVLGGCSSINGMIYMRGQARDFDQWATKTGDDHWKWDNCLPFFVQHEDYHGGLNEFHGVGGEWRIEKQRLRWDILDAFSQACVQAGIPEVEDFNRGSNEGVSYFDVNQKSGWRWNTTRAFLRPIMGRSNLEVWTHAQVAKLLLTSDSNGKSHCSGVDVALPSGRVSINAREAVVLSAGAIGTPQILQLSGIGPANLLQKYGITTLVNLPGVGQNLQDHLQIRSVYKVEGVNTLNTLSNSFWGKAKIGMEYAFKRSGPMSMAPSQLGAFTRSSADQTYPNIEYHVQPLSLDAFGEPLHDFPAFTASVCNLNPSSRGEVNITSPDFLSSPDIVPNYLSTEEDRKVAADSLRVTRRIVSQPALEKYKPQEWKPGEQYQSDEELARLAGDIATTIFHPVGTASMGSDDDPLAVLDSKLRVRDGRGGVVNSLRVVDASAMPSITSGNTNSPTLMMAEKAAQWLVA